MHITELILWHNTYSLSACLQEWGTIWLHSKWAWLESDIGLFQQSVPVKNSKYSCFVTVLASLTDLFGYTIEANTNTKFYINCSILWLHWGESGVMEQETRMGSERMESSPRLPHEHGSTCLELSMTLIQALSYKPSYIMFKFRKLF